MGSIFEEFLIPYFNEDIELKCLVHDILGTTDPEQVQTLVHQSLTAHVDSDIDKILFLAPWQVPYLVSY